LPSALADGPNVQNARWALAQKQIKNLAKAGEVRLLIHPSAKADGNEEKTIIPKLYSLI
jgi:hypothetical protein